MNNSGSRSRDDVNAAIKHITCSARHVMSDLNTSASIGCYDVPLDTITEYMSSAAWIIDELLDAVEVLQLREIELNKIVNQTLKKYVDDGLIDAQSAEALRSTLRSLRSN